MMGEPSAASSSSSSSSSLDGHRQRHHHDRRHRHRRRQQDSRRGDKRGKTNRDDNTASTTARAMPAAPSDWDELRAHYQFVLPTDNDGNNYTNSVNNNTNDAEKNQKYGATWQERMVKHYHSHLYKEYVLADLSRVHDLGKVGLRWRTEKEVANGRGFRCCGNLKCEGVTKNNNGGNNDGEAASEKEAYAAAARRHMGIAVAENGGKEPIGVVLPNSDKEAHDALESYLQSCAEERRNMQQVERPDKNSIDGLRDKRRSRKSSKHKRKRHRHSHKHSRRDKHHHSSPQHEYSSLKEQESREQDRLSLLPHGMGLHDYEVDFVYVERGVKKRELVKVRLCLRCAPLLFIAKMNDGNDVKKKKERGGAPAVKAREARENAARSHYQTMIANDDDNNGLLENGNGNATSDPIAEGAAAAKLGKTSGTNNLGDINDERRYGYEDDSSDLNKSSSNDSDSDNHRSRKHHRSRRKYNGKHGSKRRRRHSDSSSSLSDS